MLIFVYSDKTHNKHIKIAPMALDSQQVARLLGGR